MLCDVARARLPSLIVRAYVAAVLNVSRLNVAIPPIALTDIEELPLENLPLAKVMVTVEVSVLTRLPYWSWIATRRLVVVPRPTSPVVGC